MVFSIAGHTVRKDPGFWLPLPEMVLSALTPSS